VSDCDFLADEALRIGSRYGLGGMDALHIAAALEAGADEFITSERLTSPLFRVQGITVRTIA
jgi:predicted nucleic acid-binding protein